MEGIAANTLENAGEWTDIEDTQFHTEVNTADLISPLMVGFMGNMLPARAGEFIRAYLMGKREQISFSASFATIFISSAKTSTGREITIFKKIKRLLK